ncbi:putative fasciclin-like arabinogalactan protein 20-like [Hibiscus syriacus]|uniref:Fasciclin-like arabinogalactan protein 20-like n=1 Tax=Hibiscus syriacus TaxID=106335 RepID=A0A6A3ATM2_HIBSY|nr:putative fasciclin-like arabinogalactan protein 20-like [Hibiscus syriacus]
MEIVSEPNEGNSRRIQVRFVTKLKALYKVPNTAIAIPSHLHRLGLSSIVNKLLQAVNSEWKTEPFDFLIDGELARMPLEEFLLAKGTSALVRFERFSGSGRFTNSGSTGNALSEGIPAKELLIAAAPRKEEEPCLHDDWVSAVDGSCPRFILTGCYDGLGRDSLFQGVQLAEIVLSLFFYGISSRVWKQAGWCTRILEGHSGAVSSVSIIKSEGIGSSMVATASKDQTVRLWKFNAEDSSDQPARLRAFTILRGHNASVHSVAAKTSGDMICSGSWDCTINVWRTNDSDIDGDMVSIKKRKVNNEIEESQSVWSLLTLEMVEFGCLDHHRRGGVYTCGPYTVRLLCGLASTRDDLFCIMGSLRTSAPVFQFSSHSSWISDCKWHSWSSFHLLSSSYDGKVMLWDLRTAFPLAIIDSHKNKVLCAGWWKGDCVVSGGAGAQLRISSDISIH